jgi:hypothetical protein
MAVYEHGRDMIGKRWISKGYISDPKSKAKSVMMSEDGEKLSKELFTKYFSSKS